MEIGDGGARVERLRRISHHGAASHAAGAARRRGYSFPSAGFRAIATGDHDNAVNISPLASIGQVTAVG
jgi:hypothetical protein